ncbi:gluconate 2-dehydrogenase subunit 3 family protein [uncultured Methylovirgula sp.]|uniref:gluconate 2-dehydrogenase subunit 3 family protein n=1 Tax=uncultured Methylovirgula sp. TaxID=1285960 RepID=UPI002601C292|nr:gluconate 2-dehydrogenase subunit 3 family protein [uncultured Methylovirgula sp.]
MAVLRQALKRRPRTGGRSVSVTSETVNRRGFLIGGAIVGAAGAASAAPQLHDGELGAPPATYRGAVPWQEGAADSPPEVVGTDFKFFTAKEKAFIEAATNRLIPADSTGPSAVEANVPFFIDRQLAGPFGRGDHYYLGGPWPKGVPTQGYQSRFSPAQLYRGAIAAIERYTGGRHNGAAFSELAATDQDVVLKGLEDGSIELDGGVDAKSFFAMLLQNTKEGYFSDPIYGGNKDMAAWKMIGFPGAHYDYSEWVGRHNERVPYPPVSFKGRPGWTEG